MPIKIPIRRLSSRAWYTLAVSPNMMLHIYTGNKMNATTARLMQKNHKGIKLVDQECGLYPSTLEHIIIGIKIDMPEYMIASYKRLILL